jgi:hypothetical protein
MGINKLPREAGRGRRRKSGRRGARRGKGYRKVGLGINKLPREAGRGRRRKSGRREQGEERDTGRLDWA